MSLQKKNKNAFSFTTVGGKDNISAFKIWKSEAWKH